MNDLEPAREILTELVIPFCIGASAAIARLGKHGWLGLANFCRELVLCCFYGIVMYWLLDLADIPLSVKFGITGAGVYCLLEIGDAVFERMKKLIQSFEISDVLGRKGQ